MNGDVVDAPTRGAIVVGVDGSVAGSRAFEWAANQAALERRPLVPVRAADSGPERRGLADNTHLVVVGSRGTGPVHHGSAWQICTQVARRAACPVVIVPSHHPGLVRQGVLVGADLDERSAKVLRFGFQLASVRGLPLTVAHILGDGPDLGFRDAERHLAESTCDLDEEFPEVDVRLEVRHGAPTGGLLSMATRMHLLVIGQYHALDPFESPIGHVHAGLVDRSPCPVAVVPQTVQLDGTATIRVSTGASFPAH